jgi:hypothetical protein
VATDPGTVEAENTGRALDCPDEQHAGDETPPAAKARPLLGPYSINVILGWLAVLLAAFVALQNPGNRPAFFEPAGVLHYYLGAKYFDELGPFDLYACAIAADRQASQVWFDEVQVRDLHTYRLTAANTRSCPRSRFTPARWAAFVTDVSWITDTATTAEWASAVTDKGYNATPFFSVVFGQVARVATAFRMTGHHLRYILFNLDVVFLALSIWIVWRSAGTTTALLTLVLALGFFGNFGRIGGNFGQYVWFPLVAWAIAAWRAHRPVASGAALGLAAGFQVFPVFFALPVLLSGLGSLVRREREGWRRPLVFALSLAVTVGACVAAGGVSARGMGAWRTWQQKLAIHSAYLHGEIFDIGLPNLVADVVSRDHVSTDSYVEDIPHSLARQAALGAHPRVWFVSAAVLLALCVGAVGSVPAGAVFALGFLPLYALLTLSPYYYFALALLPFMAVDVARRQYRILVGALVLVFVINLEVLAGSDISFSFWRHAVSQLLIAGFAALTGLVPLLVRDRPTVGAASSNAIAQSP